MRRASLLVVLALILTAPFFLTDAFVQAGPGKPAPPPTFSDSGPEPQLSRILVEIENNQLDKALQLTGGPESKKAPEGRNQYAWVMEEKQADVFLTYCTNAVAVQKENSDLHVTPIPEALAVGADYGLIVRGDADPAAWQFALYILSGAGQDILKKYGFEAVTLQKN